MICQRIGRSRISIIGFGRVEVSSLRRLPRPPARITAFICAFVTGPDIEKGLCSAIGGYERLVGASPISTSDLARAVVARSAHHSAKPEERRNQAVRG